MSESTSESRLSLVTTLGCALICAVLTIPFGIIVSQVFFALQRSQQPEFNVVRNDSAQSWQLETTNPSPVARRVTEVRFTLFTHLPPERRIGAIELEKVVFEQSDYDESTKTFRKVLHGVEMPANGNLNMQFFVRQPKLKDHRLLGRLEIYFDDRTKPNVVAYDDFSILCID